MTVLLLGVGVYGVCGFGGYDSGVSKSGNLDVILLIVEFVL